MIERRGVVAGFAVLLSGVSPGFAADAQAASPPPATILTLGGPPQSVYGVDATTGKRTAISNLSNANQGQTLGAYRLAAGGHRTVVVTGLSTTKSDAGLLVRVDPTTGKRTVVSDFSSAAQGPIGYTPFGAAVVSDSEFLVTDRGQGGGGNNAALWRIKNGVRTKLSNFSTSTQGPIAESPEGVVLDASKQIWVADAKGGTDCNAEGDGCGSLFKVDATTGNRTLVSDFGNNAQGPLGVDPSGIAVDRDGSLLIIDPFAGTCGCGELFRVDPANGNRTLLSDFGNATQGPTGGARPTAVLVNSGAILTDGCTGASGNGAICRIDRTTGKRTNFGDFGDASLGPKAFGPGGTLARLPKDTSPPTISIKAPADGAHYKQGSKVLASYSCSDADGKTDVAFCQGPAPPGKAIATSTPGKHAFTVQAADKAGNKSKRTVHYVVDTTEKSPPNVGGFPANHGCVPHGLNLHVSVHPKHLEHVVVSLDGKQILVTTKAKFTLKIEAGKLKPGRHKLKIERDYKSGAKRKSSFSFAVCTGGGRSPHIRVQGIPDQGSCTVNPFSLAVTVNGAVLSTIVVRLDGKQITKPGKSKFTVTIDVTKLKAGVHRVTIRAADKLKNSSLSVTEFVRCA